ncbi:hypothetical protein V6Z11_A01G086200 [Gossypium hirsutum]
MEETLVVGKVKLEGGRTARSKADMDIGRDQVRPREFQVDVLVRFHTYRGASLEAMPWG